MREELKNYKVLRQHGRSFIGATFDVKEVGDIVTRNTFDSETQHLLDSKAIELYTKSTIKCRAKFGFDLVDLEDHSIDGWYNDGQICELTKQQLDKHAGRFGIVKEV